MRINTKDGISADYNVVSAGFFKTLGVPILEGRDFQASDTEGSPLVTIVNETLARKISPDGDAVGKWIAGVGRNSESAQVIAVVADVRYRSLREPAPAMLYVPNTQSYMPTMTLLIRTSHSSGQNPIPGFVSKWNRDLPVYDLQTLEQKLSSSLVEEQILASLLSTFGFLALVLAGAGLYSLLSYLAQTRTREIGVRMAVGASKQNVLISVISHGLVLSLIGILGGLLLSLPAARLIQNWLFEVTPVDLWTYSGMTIVMVITSLLASYIPARRAANVDPVIALRYE
jgi:putative ABC transport system permease protein